VKYHVTNFCFTDTFRETAGSVASCRIRASGVITCSREFTPLTPVISHPEVRLSTSVRFHWKGDTDCSHFMFRLYRNCCFSFFYPSLPSLPVLGPSLPFRSVPLPPSLFPSYLSVLKPAFSSYPCPSLLFRYFAFSLHFRHFPCFYFSPSPPYVFFLCPHFFRFASAVSDRGITETRRSRLINTTLDITVHLYFPHSLSNTYANSYQ